MLSEWTLNIPFFMNMSGNLNMQIHFLLARSSIVIPKQQAWRGARSTQLGRRCLWTKLRLNALLPPEYTAFCTARLAQMMSLNLSY